MKTTVHRQYSSLCHQAQSRICQNYSLQNQINRSIFNSAQSINSQFNCQVVSQPLYQYTRYNLSYLNRIGNNLEYNNKSNSNSIINNSNFNKSNISNFQNNNNNLQQISKRSIIPIIAKRINEDIDEIRKDIQFEHVLRQRSDWMSYLILQISFKKNTTFISLKSFEKNLFHISSGLYNRFKRKSGLLPKWTKRTPRGNHEVTPEMTEWIIRFLHDQNVSYVHLQICGFNRTRNQVLRKIFDSMNIMQLSDYTDFTFKRQRRKQRPGIKQRFRPKGSIKIGKSRLRKSEKSVLDPLEHFGAA